MLKAFGMDVDDTPLDLSKWDNILERVQKPDGEVTVAIVGKYTGIGDAYKSLTEALDHAGIENQTKVNVRWVDASGFDIKDGRQIIWRCGCDIGAGRFW